MADAPRAATAVVIESNALRQQHSVALLGRCGIEVVALAATVKRTAELVEKHTPDLLIVSVGEHTESNTVYTSLRKAHKRSTGLVTVALVEHDHSRLVEAAVAAGAVASLPPSTTMLEVARLALAALAELQRSADGASGLRVRARLTRRETEILRLVAEGRSNREVAKLLWVTDQTVKFHLANTYRKLGVRNRVEASHWASGRGLVRPKALVGPRAASGFSNSNLRRSASHDT
jgi:DNA-binding NarL/FixJ family response regulator